MDASILDDAGVVLRKAMKDIAFFAIKTCDLATREDPMKASAVLSLAHEHLATAAAALGELRATAIADAVLERDVGE